MKSFLLCVGTLIVASINSSAQLYSIRCDFAQIGPYSVNNVVLSNGKLYGTANSPNDQSCFSINPDGSNFQVLHVFKKPDGQYPESRLLLTGNMIYGTTEVGGPGGAGVVFAMQNDGTSYSVLKSFAVGQPHGNYITNEDGAYPLAQLAIGGGRLFGTTPAGGHAAGGTLYSVATNGTGFIVLHHFGGTGDGWVPQAPLLLLTNQVYGMTQDTQDSGDMGGGAIFRVLTDGSEFSIIHTFAPGAYTEFSKYTNSDGRHPSGVLISDGSYLYGVAPSGGSFGNGTVFRLKLDGSEFLTLKHFSPDLVRTTGSVPNADGSEPIGGLLLVGDRLYGVAYNGGSSGFGTLYSLRTDGSDFNVLYNFIPETSGFAVRDALSVSGDTFYGSTAFGREMYDRGVIFALTLVPRFLSAHANGDGISLNCGLVPGRRHILQFATALNTKDWRDLSPTFTATNSSLQIDDAPGTVSQRFYRLLLLP